MNTTKTILTTIAALSFSFTAYGEDHSGHNHAKGEHQHAEKDHGHDHTKKVAGPNGGKVINSVTPHAEFLVTKDKKIRITFLDKENKPIAAEEQQVSIICGDRKSPTKLALKKEADGKSLLSDGTLPEGNNIPTIVTFKMTPDAKKVRAKFSLNLSDCPNCENKEYACTCEH